MCGILHVNVSSCLEDMRLKIMLTKSVLSEALRNFAKFSSRYFATKGKKEIHC